MTPALEAALAYVARGWPVFPVHGVLPGGRCTCGKHPCGEDNRNAGKHPLTAHGCKDATLDPGTVRGWLRSHPDAGIAIATGGRLAVLDVDPRHGGDDALDKLQREVCPLPSTAEVLTGGGGKHIYLEVPEGVRVGTTAGKLGPGLDVRGEGGYVVAPPSQHVSGRAYAWEASSDPADGVLPAPVPTLWLSRLAATNGQAHRLAPSAGDPGPIPQGERNDALFRLGRSLRAKGLSAAAILAALEAENGARCNPPLPADEVQKLAESAASVRAGRSAQWEKEHEGPGARPREPGEDEDAPPPRDPGTDTVTGGSWADELRRSKQGDPLNTFRNLCIILRHSDDYASLAYNRMRLTPELGGAAIDDAKAGAIRERVEAEWRFSPGADNLRSALLTVSSERTYHPVEGYLTGLAWDGTERLDRVAAEVLHASAEDPARLALAAVQVRALLVSCCARVMEPGCKVDTALVLVGPQGWYKSTFFRVLAGSEWFSDSPIDLSNKDALLQLHDTWLYEWPEIETITSQRHAGQVKAFVTSQVDLFRAPYASAVARVPRTNVLVGSTNEPRFLEDPTGSRRFWIVTLGARVDLALLRSWRDQLWAEAMHAYRSGQAWHLPEDAEKVRREVAEDHRTTDPWEAVVAAWLGTREATTRPLTTAEVLRRALTLEPGQQHRGHENRCGAVLRALGYVVKKARTGTWAAELGRETAWIWTREDAPCSG